MGRLAVQAKPRPRLWRVARRIARQFEPSVAAVFIRAVDEWRGLIDEEALIQALQSKQLPRIESAAQAERIIAILSDSDLERVLIEVSRATGEAGAEILSLVTGLDATFNASDPNVTFWARRNVGLLISEVGEDVREAIRVIVALGNELGLTVTQQAWAIRETIGLHSTRVIAPVNFARQLREMDLAALDRLLHDPLLPPRQRNGMRRRVEAEIRGRFATGTVTEEWVQAQQAAYARNLLNRRALDIARTESLRAAHAGQRIGWGQAVRDGVLPSSARRVWIVTPDDRLRETHAAVPGMNPEGVAVDVGIGGGNRHWRARDSTGRFARTTYRTPLGDSLGPPLETNCRCSEGLIFPGLSGML